MSYTVVISKSVQKQIDDLPNEMKERIAEKIQNLADEPRPDGVVKLKGSDNEYRILFSSCSVNIEKMFIGNKALSLMSDYPRGSAKGRSHRMKDDSKIKH